MNLYLYNTADKTSLLKLEDVLSYTDSQVVTASGVYAPLAEGWELSKTPDCAQTLRADWHRNNPDTATRLEELEALMAELLFGGDGV